MTTGHSGLFSPIKDSGFLRIAFIEIFCCPCGHDTHRAGLLSPIRVSGLLGVSFFEDYVVPAGMTRVVRGVCLHSSFRIFRNVIFWKL